MSLDEIRRYKESYTRRYQREHKKNINYMYILADLIGMSNSRIHIKNARYPQIHELFPNLFKEEDTIDEELEEKKAVAWIYQFANSYNRRFNKENKQ